VVASIREVAAHASVSLGTVSAVLNHPSRVAPATRARVLNAIEALGYVRNESARHLRVGQGRIIGLVVPDLTNPFYTDIARGIEDAANDNGLAVILCNSDESADKERSYLELLEQLRVRGVLITPVSGTLERLERLAARNVGVVLLDNPTSAPDLCSVAVNDIIGGDLAATHLLALGHRRIAFVTGPMTLRQCRERYEGAVRALERAGLGADHLTVVEQPNMTIDSGQRAAERLVVQASRPSAAFCANDLLAMGLLQRMVSLGVEVPRRMAIVGYDDISFAAAATVPLSSVRQQRHFIGRQAAELLLAEVADIEHHQHQRVVLEPELIVRASSGGPVTPDD
jgi:LacI family transcriptional regulator